MLKKAYQDELDRKDTSDSSEEVERFSSSAIDYDRDGTYKGMEESEPLQIIEPAGYDKPKPLSLVATQEECCKEDSDNSESKPRLLTSTPYGYPPNDEVTRSYKHSSLNESIADENESSFGDRYQSNDLKPHAKSDGAFNVSPTKLESGRSTDSNEKVAEHNSTEYLSASFGEPGYSPKTRQDTKEMNLSNKRLEHESFSSDDLEEEALQTAFLSEDDVDKPDDKTASMEEFEMLEKLLKAEKEQHLSSLPEVKEVSIDEDDRADDKIVPRYDGSAGGGENYRKVDEGDGSGNNASDDSKFNRYIHDTDSAGSDHDSLDRDNKTASMEEFELLEKLLKQEKETRLQSLTKEHATSEHARENDHVDDGRTELIPETSRESNSLEVLAEINEPKDSTESNDINSKPSSFSTSASKKLAHSSHVVENDDLLELIGSDKSIASDSEELEEQENLSIDNNNGDVNKELHSNIGNDVTVDEVDGSSKSDNHPHPVVSVQETQHMMTPMYSTANRVSLSAPVIPLYSPSDEHLAAFVSTV